jgi:putative ABC transport system substrate-binding protein
MGERQQRSDAPDRGRGRGAQADRRSRQRHADGGSPAARNELNSDRVRRDQRTRGARLRCQHGATGGNITGFTQIDFAVVGKSVEMLKAIAPALERVGLMYNPETYGFYDTYLERFQADARWQMELARAAVRTPPDIEVAIADIASRARGGLVVLSDTFNFVNNAGIRAALDRHPLPHIVPWRHYVADGGLMSYGPDIDDVFRRSADYVDRILRGGNPAELPVQAPTKFELVINLKTAKALGLNAPSHLLAVADEVIE